ncbi:hypothetical protein [Erwinia tracheiphila]|uniref:hypothetical protein n=1 Tax=Erwinia tracheiphila TaxID=65700 RepID=UPI001FD84411|nr:hypothetical protein [Erwinia tracheiphila]
MAIWNDRRGTTPDGSHLVRGTLAPLLMLLDPDTRHSVGGDFARIADLSIFSISSIEQDTRRRLRLTVELRSVPYNQQREIIFFILHGTPRLVGGSAGCRGERWLSG